MKISSKEMAVAVGKTPSAISYLKNKYNNEFQLLKIGVLCKKLNLDNEDLMAMYLLKQVELKKISV